MIASAVLFLGIIFLVKNGLLFNNTKNKQSELTYTTVTIGDLVNKSTSGDGIPDWEKSLWGLDPRKKENVPGVPDSVTIEKLKAAQKSSLGEPSGTTGSQTPEKLTQTDQFSRDLFTTIAAATQNGQPLDQATIDKISSSLVDHVQNSTQRKIYKISDLKIISDNSVKAIRNYSDIWDNIHAKYPSKGNAMDILQKFNGDGENVDASALIKLGPITEQTNNIISALVKMNVPQYLSTLHLTIINSLQGLSENMSDIKLYDTDVIVSLSAISQYNKNTDTLGTAVDNIKKLIDQKLSN